MLNWHSFLAVSIAGLPVLAACSLSPTSEPETSSESNTTTSAPDTNDPSSHSAATAKNLQLATAWSAATLLAKFVLAPTPVSQLAQAIA